MDLKTYSGNCHCGAFKFELNIPQIKTVTICDCSVCFKKSYLWIIPKAEQFKVIRGADVLVGYSFGSKSNTHKFCPTCGSGVLMEDHTAAAGNTLRINARMLMDVNPFSLEASSTNQPQCSEPIYIPPSFAGDLPTPNFELENSKIYTGGCHCGAISLVIKTQPLPEVEIKEDNCSICQRNANICIYPHQSQVKITNIENSITEYLFGRKFIGHCFCKTCGVPINMKIHGPPKAIFDSWSEARKSAVRGSFEILPLRVRLLDGVEWSRVNVKRSDEGTGGYTVE